MIRHCRLAQNKHLFYATILFAGIVQACFGAAALKLASRMSAIKIANVERLRQGMTLEEVEALLAGPPRTEIGLDRLEIDRVALAARPHVGPEFDKRNLDEIEAEFFWRQHSVFLHGRDTDRWASPVKDIGSRENWSSWCYLIDTTDWRTLARFRSSRLTKTFSTTSIPWSLVELKEEHTGWRKSERSYIENTI